MNNNSKVSLLSKANDLQTKIEEESTKEYYYRVSELKSILPKKNRCIICTLTLPCKHFSTISEMPEPEPILPDSSTQDTLIKSQNYDTLPPITLSKDVSFNVRFRGKQTIVEVWVF